MKLLTPKTVSVRSFSLVMILWLSMSMALVVACSEDEESDTTTPDLSITSFTPTSGAAGTTVTITGTGFSTTASDNTVAFNGTEATVASATSTTVSTTVPEGATTGTLSVTVDGETATSSDEFTVSTEDDDDTGGTADCGDATTITELVVCAANAFMETLSEDQLATLVVDYAVENATAWSNLPCGSDCRVGIELTDLSDEQKVAALAVVEAATGSGDNEGYAEINQIRAADSVIAAASGGGGGGPGGGGYGADVYLIAFLGTPSTTDTWQLQFGGHHLGHNITYEAGAVTGATPLFEGVEPTSWTGADGNTYAPLDQEQNAMAAMLASLSDSELTSAQLSQTFSDVLLGPDEDGQFPEIQIRLSRQCANGRSESPGDGGDGPLGYRC